MHLDGLAQRADDEPVLFCHQWLLLNHTLDQGGVTLLQQEAHNLRDVDDWAQNHQHFFKKVLLLGLLLNLCEEQLHKVQNG